MIVKEEAKQIISIADISSFLLNQIYKYKSQIMSPTSVQRNWEGFLS